MRFIPKKFDEFYRFCDAVDKFESNNTKYYFTITPHSSGYTVKALDENDEWSGDRYITSLRQLKEFIKLYKEKK